MRMGFVCEDFVWTGFSVVLRTPRILSFYDNQTTNSSVGEHRRRKAWKKEGGRGEVDATHHQTESSEREAEKMK